MRKMDGLLKIVLGLGIVSFVFSGFNLVLAQGNNPFEKAIEDRFNAMDTNKDGKVNYDEYKTGYEKSIKTSFERRDKNSDGILTKDEFMPKGQSFQMKKGANPFQNVKPKSQDAGKQN